MAHFTRIKLLVLDFDGVMTDNRVLVDETGQEAVFCNRSDGLGIEMLKQKTNIPVLVISKEKNGVVKARCDKLKIECLHGVDDKLTILRNYLGSKNVDPATVCYVGNDINDLECMGFVGLPVAVADAYPSVKAVAKYTTGKKGGEGAVREVADLIISSS